MQKDLYNKVISKLALAPIVLNSDTDNAFAIIDTQGFNSAKVILKVGVVTAGDITIKEVQESDDSGMSGETPIPTARLQGDLETLDTSGTFTELGIIPTKRYIRVVATTANSANLLADCTVELGDPDQAPVR